MTYTLGGSIEVDVSRPSHDCVIDCIKAMRYTWKVPLVLENNETQESLELMFFEDSFGAEYKDAAGACFANTNALDMDSAIRLLTSFMEGESPGTSGPDWNDISAERIHSSAAQIPNMDKWLIAFLIIVGLGLLFGAIAYVWSITPP